MSDPTPPAGTPAARSTGSSTGPSTATTTLCIGFALLGTGTALLTTSHLVAIVLMLAAVGAFSVAAASGLGRRCGDEHR